MAKTLTAVFLVAIILLSSVGLMFVVYPNISSPVKQAVLIVGPTGNQIHIADTWVQGNITTDSGISPFKSTSQQVFGSVFRLSTVGSVNGNGQVAYNVYAISYSFQDVCTQFLTGQHVDCSKGFSVDLSVIDYKLSVTTVITAKQVNGSATYNVNGPSETTEQLTYATQGQTQVVMGGVSDISSVLRQNNAPYGDYQITVSVKEDWAVWAQDLTNFLSPIDMLLCWISGGLNNPACVGIYQLEGPFTVPIEPQVATVTFGSSITPTFYLAAPTSITIGTLDGQTQILTVTLLPWNGFTGTVHVSFQFPAGITLSSTGVTQMDIPLPAPPVQYVIQAAPQTTLGNVTITTTATSGTVTRTQTTQLIVVQHATGINPTQNTKLTATTDQSIYAQLAPLTVKGKLTTGNGASIPNAPIDVQIQGVGNPTTVSTGSDGSYSASLFAPNTQGTYTVNVAFKGNSQYGASSTIVTFVVRQPVLSDYLPYIILAAVIVTAIAGLYVFMRTRKSPSSMMGAA